jgi:hypothetical protein
MRFNRDSVYWWLGVAAAVVLALSTLDTSGEGPTSLMYYGVPVSWAPYLRLLALLIGVVSGYLKKSPLPPAVKTLLILLLIGPSFGCASATSARHTATIADTAIAKSLFALQDVEMALFTDGKVTPAEHQSFNKQFAPILKLGLQINRTIRSWPANAPAPTELTSLITQLRALNAQVFTAFKLNEQIKIALDAALAILQALPLGGTHELHDTESVAPHDGTHRYDFRSARHEHSIRDDDARSRSGRRAA